VKEEVAGGTPATGVPVLGDMLPVPRRAAETLSVMQASQNARARLTGRKTATGAAAVMASPCAQRRLVSVLRRRVAVQQLGEEKNARLALLGGPAVIHAVVSTVSLSAPCVHV